MKDFVKALFTVLFASAFLTFVILYIADGFRPPCSCECKPEPRPPVKKMT